MSRDLVRLRFIAPDLRSGGQVRDQSGQVRAALDMSSKVFVGFCWHTFQC